MAKGDNFSSASETQKMAHFRVDEFDPEEQSKWLQLSRELKHGLDAAESDFVLLDADALITEALLRRNAKG